MTRALRLAHRGDWRAAPENTLAALLAALALPGCDGLEFDVRAAANGVPVLLHDPTLERVFGRAEAVADVSSIDLAAVGVPTLHDVLAAVPRDAFLDVELKGDPGDGVIEVLEASRGPSLEAAVVSSFTPAALERVARARPSWPMWLNADRIDDHAIATALGLGCRGIAAAWRGIDPAGADRVHAAGLELAAWTVRRPQTATRLERLGAVAICVEGPALDG